MAKKNKTVWQKIRYYTLRSIYIFVGVSLFWVLLYKWVNPPGTFLMLSRKMSATAPDFKIKHQWVDIEKISPNLQLALIIGEDQNFTEHHGFDFDAIKKAMKQNAQSNRTVGASTISQQCAKNVFLWEGRSWLRKGLEAWFTMLIELIWGKKRIMEVYLNSIEMGDGIFGAEAAAKKYFGNSAAKLSASQAAKISSIIPNPRRFTIGSYFSNVRYASILFGMKQYGIQLKYLQ